MASALLPTTYCSSGAPNRCDGVQWPRVRLLQGALPVCCFDGVQASCACHCGLCVVQILFERHVCTTDGGAKAVAKNRHLAYMKTLALKRHVMQPFEHRSVRYWSIAINGTRRLSYFYPCGELSEALSRSMASHKTSHPRSIWPVYAGPSRRSWPRTIRRCNWLPAMRRCREASARLRNWSSLMVSLGRSCVVELSEAFSSSMAWHKCFNIFESASRTPRKWAWFLLISNCVVKAAMAGVSPAPMSA